MSLVNASNLAAFAVEWEQDGTRFQLVNSRGTTSLHLGINHNGKWYSTAVTDPDTRFGLTSPPRSFQEFLTVAKRFVEAGTE